MTITRERHPHPVAEACVASVPRVPDLPVNATVHRAMRGRARDKAIVADRAEFGEVLAGLAEVAVWTSSDGAWQEHATFLLRSVVGQWRGVGFSEPHAAELVRWLCEQPGFDAGLLLELLGQHDRRIVALWRRPTAATS